MQVIYMSQTCPRLDSTDPSRQIAAALATAREAATEFQAALADLCRLGAHVTVRIEPGFEEGRTSPSVFFIEVKAG